MGVQVRRWAGQWETSRRTQRISRTIGFVFVFVLWLFSEKVDQLNGQGASCRFSLGIWTCWFHLLSMHNWALFPGVC